MNTPCFCSEQRYSSLFTSGAYSIVCCVACGQVRTISSQDAKHTQEYTKSDISVYIEKEQMFRDLFQKVVAFISRFRTDGKLVDVGAGVGLLVDEARKAGYDAYGLEPSKAAVIAAKKYFGIRLANSVFSKKTVENPDIVVLNHVLEHVPEPDKLIDEIHQVLRPKGLLIIGLPNFGSVLAQLKKGRWQSLIPNQHRWHFTRKTLDVLVIPRGFVRLGLSSSDHDRSMHPIWKRPFYAILDTISIMTATGEAILVAYEKVS